MGGKTTTATGRNIARQPIATARRFREESFEKDEWDAFYQDGTPALARAKVVSGGDTGAVWPTKDIWAGLQKMPDEDSQAFTGKITNGGTEDAQWVRTPKGGQERHLTFSINGRPVSMRQTWEAVYDEDDNANFEFTITVSDGEQEREFKKGMQPKDVYASTGLDLPSKSLVERLDAPSQLLDAAANAILQVKEQGGADKQAKVPAQSDYLPFEDALGKAEMSDWKLIAGTPMDDTGTYQRTFVMNMGNGKAIRIRHTWISQPNGQKVAVVERLDGDSVEESSQSDFDSWKDGHTYLEKLTEEFAQKAYEAIVGKK